MDCCGLVQAMTCASTVAYSWMLNSTSCTKNWNLAALFFALQSWCCTCFSVNLCSPPTLSVKIPIENLISRFASKNADDAHMHVMISCATVYVSINGSGFRIFRTCELWHFSIFSDLYGYWIFSIFTSANEVKEVCDHRCLSTVCRIARNLLTWFIWTNGSA